VVESIDHTEWKTAYIKQIQQFSSSIKGKKINSIFFGGGTPSLAPPKLIDSLIDHLHSNYTFTPDIEITLEANPTSIEINKFKEFKQAGINRVSVGIQSLNTKHLKFLGRTHSTKEAIQALDIAAKTFDNYTFDLMYALPNQSLSQWQNELKSALKLCKKHMSLYQLTIEKGTPFYKEHKKGIFSIPTPELAADFYECTQKIMDNHGMPAYEVSNHAAVGFESKHNLNYWSYGEYVGIGPGAHGRIHTINGITATTMIHNPNKWLQSVLSNQQGIQNSTQLSTEEVRKETIMMGMRTKIGVDQALIEPQIAKNLIELDLLAKFNNRIVATQKGVLILNSIIAELI